MKNKKHSKSSQRWLKEHFSDPYVLAAQKGGYRSRAVYKLMAIQEKDHLLRLGQNVVDLGAAPGGWSQYAAHTVGSKGKVFALDCLAFEPLAGVEIIQGDFTTDAVYQQLLMALEGCEIDLVLSDMAPNMSGMSAIDQPKSIYLIELALAFADQVLKVGGAIVLKIFQGEGFDEILCQMRQRFKQVVVRKPPASRARSREVYLVGKVFLAEDRKKC